MGGGEAITEGGFCFYVGFEVEILISNLSLPGETAT